MIHQQNFKLSPERFKLWKEWLEASGVDSPAEALEKACRISLASKKPKEENRPSNQANQGLTSPSVARPVNHFHAPVYIFQGQASEDGLRVLTPSLTAHTIQGLIAYSKESREEGSK